MLTSQNTFKKPRLVKRRKGFVIDKVTHRVMRVKGSVIDLIYLLELMWKVLMRDGFMIFFSEKIQT